MIDAASQTDIVQSELPSTNDITAAAALASQTMHPLDSTQADDTRVVLTMEKAVQCDAPDEAVSVQY